MTESGSHPGEKEILAYVDGELSPAAAEAVSDHLAACEDCRRIRDGFGSIAGALRPRPDTEPARPVWPGVERGLCEARRPVFRPAFAAAAAAAMVVGMLFGLLAGSTADREPAAGTGAIWSGLGSSLSEDGALVGAWTGMRRSDR
jgi:anti-sigma factor RsiW